MNIGKEFSLIKCSSKLLLTSEALQRFHWRERVWLLCTSGKPCAWRRDSPEVSQLWRNQDEDVVVKILILFSFFKFIDLAGEEGGREKERENE